MSSTLLSRISRDYLAHCQVHSYRMRHIADMTDDEVIRSCHRYCGEQGLTADFRKYREEIESQYAYCPYLQDFIHEGQCYDQQMIASGMILPDALPDVVIDRPKLTALCEECKNKL